MKPIWASVWVLWAAATAMLTGCATTGTNGVATIGPNEYMIGSLGNFTDVSGSAVEARLFGQARAYCSSRALTMVPISGKSKDAGFGQYASAEVKFSCDPPAQVSKGQ